MSDTKERAGAAGVVVAGVFFKIALYVCVVVLLFWIVSLVIIGSKPVLLLF